MASTVIGITVCLDRGRRISQGLDYLYLRRSYSNIIARVGAIPVLLTPDTDVRACVELCAGIVISGGGDLPRELGSIRAEPTLGDAEESERVAWELALLAEIERMGRPCLGVCYGMQLMNLYAGGSLLRSVTEEVSGHVDHGGQGGHAEHDVTQVAPSVLLAGLAPIFLTNSSHGQAVDRVAQGFTVTARSADGVVEAIEQAEKARYGVEWHPEADATGAQVYGKFVTMCRNAAHEQRA